MSKHGFCANERENTRQNPEIPNGNTPKLSSQVAEFMAVLADFAEAVGEMGATIQSIRSTISENSGQLKVLPPSSLHKIAEKSESLRETNCEMEAGMLSRRIVCR
ncbi:MAG: hypothetical protein FWB99_08015 [Treponema sp.]|nr:hypothetical protein [Treponema sp.]